MTKPKGIEPTIIYLQANRLLYQQRDQPVDKRQADQQLSNFERRFVQGSFIENL
jgi:hypothetical protein